MGVVQLIDIVCPVLQEHELTLDAIISTRGEHSAGRTSELAGRISLGGPYAVPVTSEFVAADSDLRAFVEQEADSTFHLVHMSVSFAAEPTTPTFDTVTLGLSLTSAGPPTPVAWSMTPLRMTSTSHVEQRLRLGPQLKLVDAEFERTTARDREEVYLQAQRELRSDPAWEFRRTRTAPLHGSHRLVMVIRAGLGQSTAITATVQATVRRPLLRRYKHEVPSAYTLEAVI